MNMFLVFSRIMLAAALAAGGGKHGAGAVAPRLAVADTGDATGASVTPAMVEEGRKIFHGQGGCFACHGADLQGSAVAPPLNKQGKPWIVAKGGTYTTIMGIITHGVPGTIMLSHPNGISDALVAKVAAYIWAVNHLGVKP